MSRRAALIVVAACGGGGTTTTATPVGAQLGPLLVAAIDAADHARIAWRCAASDGPTLTTETVTTKGRQWELSDHAIALAGKPTARPIVIGAIADAGGGSPATLRLLDRLRPALAPADLVLALGGMGTTQLELEATLGRLAGPGLAPVVAVPGDLESVAAQTAAIATLRAQGHVVVDGRLAQRIELPSATIELIAGATAASRLVAGTEGCVYAAADAERVITALSARPGLRILATAEAPRAMEAGEATGELVITATKAQPIDIALHGPTGEPATRARSGSRDGRATSLTPGTIDASPRLPAPARPPTAGLLTISGRSWTWKPITLPRLK